MSRRYLRKLARRCAPMTVRPEPEPVVDLPLVLGVLAVVGVLMVVGGWV